MLPCNAAAPTVVKYAVAAAVLAVLLYVIIAVPEFRYYAIIVVVIGVAVKLQVWRFLPSDKERVARSVENAVEEELQELREKYDALKREHKKCASRKASGGGGRSGRHHAPAPAIAPPSSPLALMPPGMSHAHLSMMSHGHYAPSPPPSPRMAPYGPYGYDARSLSVGSMGSRAPSLPPSPTASVGWMPPPSPYGGLNVSAMPPTPRSPRAGPSPYRSPMHGPRHPYPPY